jgi:hypothetical protein
VTTEWTKAKRRGRADRLEPERRGQDDRVRSTRCARRPGAPVSTPLRWDEVNGVTRSGRVHDGREVARAGSSRRRRPRSRDVCTREASRRSEPRGCARRRVVCALEARLPGSRRARSSVRRAMRSRPASTRYAAAAGETHLAVDTHVPRLASAEQR